MQHFDGTFSGCDRLSLYYQSWQPDTLPRATLAIVHGLGSHSGCLRRAAVQLVAAGYSVYAFDLRGHGRSQGQRAYLNTWAEYREDLRTFLAVLQTHQVEPPIFLWGHSLGGTIVLDFALRHPASIRGLIVTAPALGKVQVPRIKMLIGQVLSRIWPRFSLTAGLDQSGSSRDAAVLADYAQDPLRHQCGTARLATEFMATANWVQTHARELQVPLLIMHGTADRITDPDGSAAFFAAVTCADKAYRSYPDSYHDLYADLNAAEVLADVKQWLNQHLPLEKQVSPLSHH